MRREPGSRPGRIEILRAVNCHGELFRRAPDIYGLGAADAVEYQSIAMNMMQSTDDYKRYCPGEERVRISDAVCRGRRRAHFPKCHGCQFNEDEQPDERVAKVVAPAREPVEAAARARVINGQIVETRKADSGIGSMFRISDIVGAVPDPMSDDAAWRIGHATAQFLRSKLRGYDRADPEANSIVIGRDSRPHSPQIERALVEGIRATGTDVMMLGIVDTPQLYFAVEKIGACGGVMISAGHHNITDNGFRICGVGATPIGIDTGLGSIRDIAVRVPRHVTGANSRRLDRDFSEAYSEFVRRPLAGAKSRLPRPLKVVVDASNGAAGVSINNIFRGIRNLRILRVNFEHDGVFKHEPNPLRNHSLREMRQVLRDEKADFAVCFDAAGERCVFVDDKSKTVRPEFMIGLIARHLLDRHPGSPIVFDHRASAATEEEILRAGGIAIRERIGASYIKRTMGENEAVFGGDLSGRFFFRDAGNSESGLLAFVHVINLMLAQSAPLSEIVRPLQRYSASGELRFRCENTERAIGNLAAALPQARTERFDGVTFRFTDWWFNVRPNAAERVLRVNIEARSRKQIDEKLASLEPFLGEPV